MGEIAADSFVSVPQQPEVFLGEVLKGSDRIEKILRFQDLVGGRVRALSSFVHESPELAMEDLKTTGAYWQEMILRAEGEKAQLAKALSATELKNDPIYTTLLDLTFGFLELAERSNDPVPLRLKGHEASPDEIQRIRYSFDSYKFARATPQDLQKVAGHEAWKNPLSDTGPAGEHMKDAYLGRLYKQLVSSLVPKGYLSVAFSESKDVGVWAAAQYNGERAEAIRDQALPVLDKLVATGQYVFRALRHDIDGERGGLTKILNGWNGELFVSLCLRELGFEVYQPTVAADVRAKIDVEAALPKGKRPWPMVLLSSLGLDTATFAGYQVKTGEAGVTGYMEKALRTLGETPETARPADLRFALPPFDVSSSPIRLRNGMTGIFITLPSFSRVKPEYISRNPGTFNVFAGKYPHPGIPTVETLLGFLEGISDNRIQTPVHVSQGRTRK